MEVISSPLFTILPLSVLVYYLINNFTLPIEYTSVVYNCYLILILLYHFWYLVLGLSQYGMFYFEYDYFTYFVGLSEPVNFDYNLFLVNIQHKLWAPAIWYLVLFHIVALIIYVIINIRLWTSNNA